MHTIGSQPHQSLHARSSSNPTWNKVCCLTLMMVALPLVFSSSAFAQEDSKSKNTAAEKAAGDETQTDAKKKSIIDHFLRVKRDRKGRPVAMQTSVTRYAMTDENGERITVDLIGVVHVGHKEYYEKLNDAFEQYDGMLYELVAPEGTVIPKGGRSGGGMNPVAGIQMMMKDGLGLEFQLDHIDYTKKNFIHADMTPEEFGASMTENGESVAKIMLKAFGQGMAMQSMGQGTDAKMLFAMFSGNRELRLRRVMAEQMQNMEGGMAMFEGDDGSTIIDHRNRKCMDILRRELGNGKKKLAIFYGAGHLPDMERRLESNFQMKRAGQYWLDAWKLTKRTYKK